VLKYWSAVVLVLGAAGAWPASARAQATVDGDRVMAVVRTVLAPALPFPETDDTGSVPAGGSPEPLWMVRTLQAGERSIEVMANPLNAINQARAMRAMAQIGAAVDAAQKRAEAQYERAIAEAKRTGRSQDVDGVGLSDEGVAGARIDAEAHVTIDVDFNQPSYTFRVESSVAPAPSRQVVIGGAVAVITVPSNLFTHKPGARPDERFCPAETIVYFGRLGTPAVHERSENTFETTVSAVVSDSAAPVRTLTLRLTGNELLMAEILRKADWNPLLELLK
jgi:hypothetical protein